MNKEKAKQIAKNTLKIFENGSYHLLDGTKVSVKKLLNQAIRNTIDYTTEDNLYLNDIGFSQKFETKFNVVNSPAIDVALNSQGTATVLNFASAKSPGGGFLQGALAQEESLARSSGLYHCLRTSEMYDYHVDQKDPIYSDWIIYTPRVPVITNNDGQLLKKPSLVDFITCAAPNATALQSKNDKRDLKEILEKRIKKILSVALLQDSQHLILGAWGCGVFGNDPKLVSGLFHKLLFNEFEGMFPEVTFAVLDSSEEKYFISPFEKNFLETK